MRLSRFNPKIPHGSKKEPILTSYPLTTTCIIRQANTVTYMHMYRQINVT